MRSTAFFFFIIISIITTPSLAQKTTVKKPFRIWIKAQSESKTAGLRGPAYLVELKDSSLIVAHVVDITSNTFLTKEYKVSEIGLLKFRQEKIVGRSVLISSLIGFTLGGIVGGIHGGDGFIGPETPIQGVFYFGSILGVAAATFIGPAFSLKIKTVLKGSQSTYEKKKESLQKFLVDLEILTESK